MLTSRWEFIFVTLYAWFWMLSFFAAYKAAKILPTNEDFSVTALLPRQQRAFVILSMPLLEFCALPPPTGNCAMCCCCWAASLSKMLTNLIQVVENWWGCGSITLYCYKATKDSSLYPNDNSQLIPLTQWTQKHFGYNLSQSSNAPHHSSSQLCFCRAAGLSKMLAILIQFWEDLMQNAEEYWSATLFCHLAVMYSAP